MGKKIMSLYLLIFLTIITLYIMVILDKLIYPQILYRGEQILKRDANEIIRNIILTESDALKDSDRYIYINTKEDGSISSIQSNGARLNAIAFKIAKLSQDEFNRAKTVGIDVPFGYVFDNSLFYNLGPRINVKIDDISYIESSYRSEFSKSGINQTIYKVFLTYNTNIRLILSREYKDVNIKTEIPIWETVIVGETPESFIDLNLENSGVKLNNADK